MDADPLVMRIAAGLVPGRALDLACGTGRNALWLAAQGWKVTAVDNSRDAIQTLESQASDRRVYIDTRVADLERGEYRIEPQSWDLIAISYYLQRDLFEPAKSGLVCDGVIIATALLAGEETGRFRVQPGELIRYFDGWEILYSREGAAPRHRAVAEIAARKI